MSVSRTDKTVRKIVILTIVLTFFRPFVKEGKC
jgi:hypothetical protein